MLRHSENAATLLGLKGEINNAPVEDALGPKLAHDLRNALGTMGEAVRPALMFDQPGPNGGRFDIAVHQYRSNVIVEFEPVAEGSVLPLQLTRTMIERVSGLETIEQLVSVGARLVRGVLGLRPGDDLPVSA